MFFSSSSFLIVQEAEFHIYTYFLSFFLVLFAFYKSPCLGTTPLILSTLYYMCLRLPAIPIALKSSNKNIFHCETTRKKQHFSTNKYIFTVETNKKDNLQLNGEINGKKIYDFLVATSRCMHHIYTQFNRSMHIPIDDGLNDTGYIDESSHYAQKHDNYGCYQQKRERKWENQ